MRTGSIDHALGILAGAAVVATALVTVASAPAAGAPSMSLEMTVGEFDGVNSCTGAAESLTVPVGTQVEYCYLMRNTGDHTLTAHGVDSDVFGTILSDVDIDLPPGEAIVGQHVETLTGTHTSTGTWTATVVQSGEPGSAVDSVTVNALPVDPDLDVAAASAALSVDMTVMVDDGTDTCGQAHSAIVEKGTPLRFCYTMTNTGDEALNLHGVYDSHIGQVAGPAHDHVVQPGDGMALTATGAFDKSALHGVTWEATGVESDTVVHGIDGLFVTVLGPAITLDMTVMIDDGHGTCGIESEISVPAGTSVLYCYTMTDSGDEAVNYHHLDDDRLGTLLDGLDREVEPGEVLVHTEVAVITETVTNTAQWTTLSQGTGTDVWADDSVTVEIVDDTEPTTTVPGSDPCVPTTPAPMTSPPETNPPETNPPVTSTPTTTTSTSSTTSTSTTTTTTTTPRSTTTTELGIVLPTTSTTLGEPAGFARRGLPGAACPESPPGGATLPATGVRIPTQAALALGLVTIGAMLLTLVERRRT